MTDAQFLALMAYHYRYTDPHRGFSEVEYTAHFSENNDGAGILRLRFYDKGGNLHNEGILPDGSVRTYEV